MPDYIQVPMSENSALRRAREEAIHAVDTYGPLDGLTEDEALIIRFGRELLEAHDVEDETFDAVRARWADGVLGPAVMNVYMMNASILRVMEHQSARRCCEF